MNGKQLKVKEYELTFGNKTRIVNVFGLFKYIPKNSLYVIYKDVDNTYEVLYYGSSHIKNNSILSMSSSNNNDEEIIKEYIYKITEKEDLKDFEIISLDNIDEIEIIGSNKLEIKKEVIDKLIDITIPKKELPKEEEPKKKKKKSPIKSLLMIIILFSAIYIIYYYFTSKPEKEEVFKTITCTSTYPHEDLENVEVEEKQVFNFDNNDVLENIDKTELYKFSTEDDYFDFINKGLYYKYAPEDTSNGSGYTTNDENHTIEIITKEEIKQGYKKPTNYEEVLSYYTKEGYTCDEKIED